MQDGRGTFVSWPRQARSAAPVKIVTGRSFARLEPALLDPQTNSRTRLARPFGRPPGAWAFLQLVTDSRG